MPIQLQNANIIPNRDEDAETINILGLDIPVEGDLDLGGQMKVVDLQAAFEAEEIGQAEFALKLFCLFTTRLPTREQVTYKWLSKQRLVPEEVTELISGVSELLAVSNKAALEAIEKDSAKKRKAAN